MIGYNEGAARSTTDRNFHITVQLLQYPPAHFLIYIPPFRFHAIFNEKSRVINFACDKSFGLVDLGQRRLEVEYSSTEWEASTEILPFINRTSFPGQDVLRRKKRNKNRERYRLKNRD